MVTKEDLQEKYTQLETIDLLEITANKPDYTELAVSVALDELKNRKVPEAEIKNYKSIFNQKPDAKTIENYFVDLNLLQKLIFYFLIIPKFRYYFNKDFGIENYVLKSQQANYYLVAGISFLIIGGISINFNRSAFLYVWLSGFVVSYLFDMGFNKARQVNDLQIKVEQGKDPWPL